MHAAILAVLAVASPLVPAAWNQGNNPPATPVVTEPAQEGQITNPEDTHMETAPFSDPDPGDTHLCSDWEIWTVSPVERIWAALCVTGLERVHIHLADGVFQGSHAGGVSLLPETNYRLRTRHRDSSGDPFTEWSQWGQRLFTTGALSSVFPLELDDIAPTPTPTWVDTGGAAVVLAGGLTPAQLRAESAAGQTLLSISGGAGGQNQIVNPPAIAAHVPVRMRLVAGGQPLVLPETDLAFTDHSGTDHVVYLPGVSLGAGQSAYYWVSSNGSTYEAQASQTLPTFAILARSAPLPWTTRAGFRVEKVAGGFQLPVNVAFIPNPGAAPDAPLFYVSELYGTIRVVRRDGTVGTYASNLINFDPTGKFPGSGEQGLTGIVVEPTTGDVYATLLYDAAPPNGPHYPKVMRFQSNTGGQTATTQSTILNMPGETQGQSHQISNISIGPDGMLYVHMGDGFDSTTALNLNSYRGKILRMNLNGAAPTNNPLYNGAPINARDYIYAYGFRNPFGGAWRQADGKHYEVENGPSIDRFALVNPGVSYGWNGSQSTMTIGAIHVWDPSVAPVNIVFVQPGTFGGSQFPAPMQGHAFVSESGSTWGTGPQELGKRITEFVLSPTGTVLSGPDTLIVYNGSGKASCAGLAAGPDGLYFTDLYKDEGFTSPIDPGANVLRIRFVGAAEFAAAVKTGPSPLAVQFTDQSNVPSPTEWLWTFGDGGTSTEANPVHVYAADGVYDVRLQVTGSGGAAVRQKNGYIRVGQPPKIVLIGGSLPPGSADQAAANYLATQGFEVDIHDDEPANRPSSAELANAYDLAIVTSTIAAANVGGEFRAADLPLVFWEQGLLRVQYEPLTDNGIAVGNVASIIVLNTTHPITQGLSPVLYPVFQPNASMSVGRGNIAPGAQLLAQRAGLATDYSLLAAEAGATLHGGYQPPARRVFMFFENTGFNNATPVARQLLERAACWAGKLDPVVVAQPQPVTVPEGEPAVFTVGLHGAAPMQYQWRRNGVNLVNGGRISGATSHTLTIDPVIAADAGAYDVVVSNTCAGATSQVAQLNVSTSCYPDCTADGQLTIADFGCFQAKFAAGDPYADCNQSGGLTIADFGCFQSEFAAGCP